MIFSQNTRDAGTSILALKLIGSARDVVTSLRGFIRTIWTIFLTVAYPRLMNASNTIVAVEFLVAVVHFLSIWSFLRKEKILMS